MIYDYELQTNGNVEDIGTFTISREGIEAKSKLKKNIMCFQRRRSLELWIFEDINDEIFLSKFHNIRRGFLDGFKYRYYCNSPNNDRLIESNQKDFYYFSLLLMLD